MLSGDLMQRLHSTDLMTRAFIEKIWTFNAAAVRSVREVCLLSVCGQTVLIILQTDDLSLDFV